MFQDQQILPPSGDNLKDVLDSVEVNYAQQYWQPL